MQQRNALLKYFHESRSFDSVSIEVWDNQLIMYGEEIIKLRNQFLDEFIPLFNKNYQLMSNSSEQVSLEYVSSLKDKSYQSVLLANLERDRAVHYTTTGPHKDDLEFKLNDYSLKKICFSRSTKIIFIGLETCAI